MGVWSYHDGYDTWGPMVRQGRPGGSGALAIKSAAPGSAIPESGKSDHDTPIIGAGKECVKMQEIKILRLTMDNFKGRRHMELDLNGGNLNVYGTNAAGKTTIFDAFTWLLFGKNSNGSGTFGIRSLSQNKGV